MPTADVMAKMNEALRKSFCRMSHRKAEEALLCETCAASAEDEQRLHDEVLLRDVNAFVERLKRTKYFWEW